SDPCDRNIISGNNLSGVADINADTVVENNYIGTNVAGEVALGNSYGIFQDHGATIKDNVVSGNHIGFFYAWSGVIQDNRIGTDQAGTTKIANEFGFYLQLLTNSALTIGGSQHGNLVSGNDIGIYVLGATPAATGNVTIVGNDIIGNAHGVFVDTGVAGE